MQVYFSQFIITVAFADYFMGNFLDIMIALCCQLLSHERYYGNMGLFFLCFESVFFLYITSYSLFPVSWLVFPVHTSPIYLNEHHAVYIY